MAPLQNAGTFLIHSLFDIYLLILLLRLLLQYLRIDYYNPLTQFIVRTTGPVVIPLRRFIPPYKSLDTATVVAILGFTFIKLILISLIGARQFPALMGLFVWSIGDLTRAFIKLFFYALLIQVVLSWMAPHARSPLTVVLERLTTPLLYPIRQRAPRLGGIDISPFLLLIFLQLLIILISDPLTQMGFRLALH